MIEPALLPSVVVGSWEVVAGPLNTDVQSAASAWRLGADRDRSPRDSVNDRVLASCKPTTAATRPASTASTASAPDAVRVRVWLRGLKRPSRAGRPG
eukprot:CAMPEP_0119429310 /NCGR_PEP_ID=MMETSP1335-20130426/41967_1 /TAXON_ID=259385 /ORGANISM="Chrysoculter rhomboideus, Strain RCC1486" /LENGTH=96 /DNA_ID=CAMNT_0007455025 /DNA_START=72 /DNA_END=358 /DNA_ORIENTATION=-